MIPMEAPRRVLLGRFRFRLMLVRCALDCWPIIAVPALILTLSPTSLLGVALCTTSIELARRGTLMGWISAPWWRARWWFDARACGLCLIADPSVNAVHEAGRPPGIELAPALRRIRCRGPIRRYVIRPLPGQRLEHFEQAIPAFSYRWAATVTVTAHRRRLVLVEVVNADAIERPLAHPHA